MSLIETARAVRENAHAPYSKFKVGAAVQAASGTVYVGCNVENVAYPEGTCAEGGAIAAMIAGGDTRSQNSRMAMWLSRSRRPTEPCWKQQLGNFFLAALTPPI